MDGYAVRSADLDPVRAGTAVTLPVVGDIPAGTASPLSVQPGLCVRIMTDGGIAKVRIYRAPDVGAYIRRLGEDVRAGDTVAVAGSHLGSARIGLIAAVGRTAVTVRPRPRVVVISTGSELVEAGRLLPCDRQRRSAR